MSSNIVNYFRHFSESIGLPPLVLIYTIAFFFFIFIFGLVILSKVRSIRKDLHIVNSSLFSLNQKIKANMKRIKAREFESSQTKPGDELILLKDEIVNKWEKKSDIKREILNILKKTSKPISYQEIVKNLSKNSNDHDFEFILKELDQLKTEGEITGLVAAGKLYFQIKKIGF